MLIKNKAGSIFNIDEVEFARISKLWEVYEIVSEEETEEALVEETLKPKAKRWNTK